MTDRERHGPGSDDDDETPPAWLPGLLELDRKREAEATTPPKDQR